MSDNNFQDTAEQSQQRRPKIIKKYGNRKLYDTQQSSYVVLKDIEKMIRNKEHLCVIDNETEDDITIPTLTQIIFGAEKKSNLSAPIEVLKDIISKGDGSFSSYLASLGLFKAQTKSVRTLQHATSKSLLSSKKKASIEQENAEQKLTKSVNCDEGTPLSSGQESIPQLPGSRLNSQY